MLTSLPAYPLAGGGYTNTDPESRRIKVADVNGRVKIKVVYVVLEAQYQSSLSAGVHVAQQQELCACLQRYARSQGWDRGGVSIGLGFRAESSLDSILSQER